MPLEKNMSAKELGYQVTKRRLQAPEPDLGLKEENQCNSPQKSAIENISLRRGLEITICKQNSPQGLKIDFEMEKAPISLSYNLGLPVRCKMAHGGGRKTEIERRPGNSLLAYLPQTKGVSESPPGRLIGLSVYISRSFLGELFTELPGAIKELERSYSAASRSRPVHHQSPIGKEENSIIQQIVQCPYRGNIRRVFLEAKALEMIAHKLAEMGGMSQLGCSELSNRELEGAREAYHILLQRIEQPPSLQDLSLMVGMNRNKLNRGFKELYGGTVFKVLRDERLLKAWSLLQDTDFSLSDIALSVGYSDQANFSNAFRRHFGQTPKIVRQGSMRRPSAN